jgi:hypothetical protein
MSCGQKFCYYLRAVFVFWDVTYLEELTLNFHLPDYDNYNAHGVMSGLKKNDDFVEDDLKKGL